MRLLFVIKNAMILLGGIFLLFYLYVKVKEQPWFSGFDANHLINAYTQEEIDHFSRFAFQDGCVEKWYVDPKVEIINHSIDSRYDEDVIEEIILTCIDTLNSLMTELQIHCTDENSNVKLKLKDSIIRRVNSYSVTSASFYRIPHPASFRGEIEVVLRDRELEGIRSAVYHEFGHLLGFDHNLTLNKSFTWAYKSLFNPPSRTFSDSLDQLVEDYQDYTSLDKAALRIMYDERVGIDPGLTQKKFFRKIEKAKKEMRK